jgi:hypothetical protein
VVPAEARLRAIRIVLAASSCLPVSATPPLVLSLSTSYVVMRTEGITLSIDAKEGQTSLPLPSAEASTPRSISMSLWPLRVTESPVIVPSCTMPMPYRSSSTVFAGTLIDSDITNGSVLPS